MRKQNFYLSHLIVVLFGLILMTSCEYTRAVWHNYPDYKDSKRFHKMEIDEEENPFHFVKSAVDYGQKLKFEDWSLMDAAFKPLNEIVKSHNTSAFVLIKNDTILYEEYFGDFDESTQLTSFSVAKSFVSILVGIAIDEGHIQGIDEPLINYIPELKEKEGFDKIKLSHLLNHTSGLKHSYMLDGLLYYATDIWRVIKRLKLDKEPGTKQQYHNMNSQLLGLVIERSTGECVSDYLKQKIWSKVGAEYPAFWNTDKNKIEKSFCCLNAAARDYAKFGRLVLNNGNWNGDQLVSQEWLDQCLARDTTNGSGWGYNKSWYMGLKEYGDFMAIGLYKQYVYVCPKKNIVIVRFGQREKFLREERIGWTRIFRQIVDQL